MIDYIVLLWPDEEDDACGASRHLVAFLTLTGWQPQVDEPGRIVLLRGLHRSSVVRLNGDDTILIGHVFDKSATVQGEVGTLRDPAPTAPFDVKCAWWCDHGWGAYVAIRRDRDDHSAFDLFRDPVGMLDCVTWAHRSLRIVTSAPEVLITQAPPVGLAIDRQRLAALLRFPGSAGETLPLTALDTVPPGRRVHIDGPKRDVRIFWSPARYAQGFPSAGAADALPGLVDACVAAWCTTSTRAIGELSGGLDSAIVASGVARMARSPVAAWFNYYAIDREGDERIYARAVADRLGLKLTESLCGHRFVDADLVAAMPLALRPMIASLSLFHDADLAERGKALGVDMLLTGQGGDALFFQPATPTVAADLRYSARSWRQKTRAVRDIALWTDRTIWPILGLWGRAHLRPAPLALPARRHDPVDPAIPDEAHPIGWMEDGHDLPPAKQLQILNLAACRAAFGGSWCSQTMRVVHPLMSQPLLEHILPIPAITLTEGRRDRALARRAYRDRLPDILIERQGKGCLTAFYGRMLATSVPFLRNYLLDGMLVKQRVLVQDRLETMLDADYLMRTNCYTEIIVALMMEQWARGWSGRLADIAQRAPVGAGILTFAK